MAEARLSDTGFSDDAHELPLPALGEPEELVERAQLPITSHEGTEIPVFISVP